MTQEPVPWEPPLAASEPEDHSERLTVCAACDRVAEQRGPCACCGAPPKPSRPDEIDLWLDLLRQPGLAERLRSMRRNELLKWADDERKLRIAALALGLKSGWAWHRNMERQGRISNR